MLVLSPRNSRSDPPHSLLSVGEDQARTVCLPKNLCPACRERVWSESLFCRKCGLQIRDLPPGGVPIPPRMSARERKERLRPLAILVGIYLALAVGAQIWFTLDPDAGKSGTAASEADQTKPCLSPLALRK